MEVETAVTIYEVYELLTTVYDVVSSDDNTELVEYINLMSDKEATTDTELIMQDVSDRLALIDTRLDLEFQCLNYGIGVIGAVLLALVSGKFCAWVTRFLTY